MSLKPALGPMVGYARAVMGIGLVRHHMREYPTGALIAGLNDKVTGNMNKEQARLAPR
ncbi:MAG: hypothetical protein OXI96_05235 [Acidimicrobiaceae bacterium]|nr:hypothetical protein [Acidimicrobiaceae bacterium]